MRYSTLATDYDGTIAMGGAVDGATLGALERFVASGRRLVLVTGRRLEDLVGVFPRVGLCERVVAENGAVAYVPATGALRLLARPPGPAFVEALVARGVAPLAVGHVVVATLEPHLETVRGVIRALGLDLHLEFNKGAVMVLPSGVTKRSGLQAVLQELRVAPGEVVGVGDGENDAALLALCGLAVSVANGVPSLRASADWVTPSPDGEGVAQLIELLLADAAPAPVRPRAG